MFYNNSFMNNKVTDEDYHKTTTTGPNNLAQLAYHACNYSLPILMVNQSITNFYIMKLLKQVTVTCKEQNICMISENKM